MPWVLQSIIPPTPDDTPWPTWTGGSAADPTQGVSTGVRPPRVFVKGAGLLPSCTQTRRLSRRPRQPGASMFVRALPCVAAGPFFCESASEKGPELGLGNSSTPGRSSGRLCCLRFSERFPGGASAPERTVFAATECPLAQASPCRSWRARPRGILRGVCLHPRNPVAPGAPWVLVVPLFVCAGWLLCLGFSSARGLLPAGPCRHEASREPGFS